jgi:hypothetical protein
MEQGNPNSLHLMEGCKRFHLPASGEGQCKKRMPMCNAFDRVEEILEHSRDDLFTCFERRLTCTRVPLRLSFMFFKRTSVLLENPAMKIPVAT